MSNARTRAASASGSVTGAGRGPQPKKLLKISELARVSGVPAATVKHYVREGLVVPKRTGRNIAYFDDAAAERIRRIKALQQDGFLPLRVIRDVLDGREPSLSKAIETIQAALGDSRGRDHQRSRSELITAGASPKELRWLEQLGAITAIPIGDEDGFGGDDLELLRTLGAARKAGITPSMLPLSILGDYLDAIRALVKVELSLFREGVLPRAGSDLGKVTEAATVLSEKLVVLVRRRLIVPTLRAMADEAGGKRVAGQPASRPRKSQTAATKPRKRKA